MQQPTALATAIQKRFLGPLARKKSPKVYVIEAESSRRRQYSISFLDKNLFPWFLAYHPFSEQILYESEA
jgi:hypothetical protein